MEAPLLRKKGVDNGRLLLVWGFVSQAGKVAGTRVGSPVDRSLNGTEVQGYEGFHTWPCHAWGVAQ